MNELDQNESKDGEDTEWGLGTISIEMLLTILLLMMNSRTEHYVISVISKFNLLFLATLVMFKEKNEKKKKNQIFDLLSG